MDIKELLDGEGTRQVIQELFPQLGEASEIGGDPLCHKDNVVDMYPFPRIPYSFSNIPFIQQAETGSCRYLLIGCNRKQASRDILSLNGLFRTARDCCTVFPRLQIEETQIHFSTKDCAGVPGGFTFLQCAPFTPTLRACEYPVILHYAAEYAWGDLFYRQDGSIGRADLYCRLKRTTFQMLCLSSSTGGTNVNPQLYIKCITAVSSYKSAKRKILYQA